MQNEQSLMDLGFKKLPSGEWFYRGTFRKFTAKVVTFNGPYPYVELSFVTDKIDKRPLSVYKGKYYRQKIKDCCSAGSVQRAILKHDILE